MAPTTADKAQEQASSGSSSSNSNDVFPSTSPSAPKPPASLHPLPLPCPQPAAVEQTAQAVSSCDDDLNSQQHELFMGSDVRHQGSEMRTLASGDDLDLLLELASLEADGLPVRWPRGWSAAEVKQVRARGR